MLKITHDYGFFSNCSVRLCQIIHYTIENKKLPEIVDSSRQCSSYKYDRNKDITFDFFTHYEKQNITISPDTHINIDICNYQFTNYKHAPMKDILPYVHKYFTPSNKIMTIRNNLIEKYKINMDDCIGMYYRGTDKITETPLDNYDSFYNKLISVYESQPNKNIQILLQTDEAQFLDYIKNKISNLNIVVVHENSVSYTRKGIHYEKGPIDNYNDMLNLFATFLILAKCKYLILNSGNCSIWMIYYREHLENVYQNLKKIWL